MDLWITEKKYSLIGSRRQQNIRSMLRRCPLRKLLAWWMKSLVECKHGLMENVGLELLNMARNLLIGIYLFDASCISAEAIGVLGGNCLSA
mmetsp:Transcript_635/g.880  ORF Transcript_635/g.880 Transcript_635/m.880 type:complete len:91 (-) Transcript_635:142-414(-)